MYTYISGPENSFPLSVSTSLASLFSPAVEDLSEVLWKTDKFPEYFTEHNTWACLALFVKTFVCLFVCFESVLIHCFLQCSHC